MLNTETLVRHCLVGAHAAGCAQAELQTATGTVADVDALKHVEDSLLQIWKLKFWS